MSMASPRFSFIYVSQIEQHFRARLSRKLTGHMQLGESLTGSMAQIMFDNDLIDIFRQLVELGYFAYPPQVTKTSICTICKLCEWNTTS